jgi:hypothetical protein
MAQILPGRFTAKHEEPLVVFLIGMRVNKCIYANMPRFGLAKAAEHVPVTGRLDNARARIELPQ